MALKSGSKIEVADITSALGSKIDKAGTGLSKSGTTLSLATVTKSGGTAGPTANATPSYGSTFTVPKVVYDKYGRVTGHANYTVKIPAAPSGGTATALSNFVVAKSGSCSGGSIDNTEFTFPSGGTWRYAIITISNYAYTIGTASGNSKISLSIWHDGSNYSGCLIGVRIS